MVGDDRIFVMVGDDRIFVMVGDDRIFVMVGDDRIFLMVGDCYAQVDAKVRSCDSDFLMEGDCCTLLDRHFRASSSCFHAYTFVLMLGSCPHTFMFMPSCSQGGLPSELTPPPHTHTDLLPHLFWLIWHNL